MKKIREGFSKDNYGYGDNSYKAAGEINGVRQLCTDFYKLMNTLPEAKAIMDMHNEPLDLAIDKLTLFLVKWFGGPKDYDQKYKSANLIQAHAHLNISEANRDAWLHCMFTAIDMQNFTSDFKEHLKKQITLPAKRIQETANGKAN